MGSSLTPQFFDGLTLVVISIGLLLAAWRIYGDFKRGPRWPNDDLDTTAEIIPPPTSDSDSTQ